MKKNLVRNMTLGVVLVGALSACGGTPVTGVTTAEPTKAAAPVAQATPAPTTSTATAKPTVDTTAKGTAMTVAQVAFADCARLTGTAKPGDALAGLVTPDLFDAINKGGVLWTITSKTDLAPVCVTGDTYAVTGEETGAKAQYTVKAKGNLAAADGQTVAIAQAYTIHLQATADAWVVTFLDPTTLSMGE